MSHTTMPEKLLPNLEKRLHLLTRVLNEADIAEKSMDIVKEIKELCAILQAWQPRQATDASRAEAAQTIVVSWAEDNRPREDNRPGQKQKPDAASDQRPSMNRARIISLPEGGGNGRKKA